MKAVILAAGIGWRLGEQGRKIPECLLEFGAETLLERHLKLLEQVDVPQAFVGVGFKADAVDQAVQATRTSVCTTSVT
jgi:choline kinase